MTIGISGRDDGGRNQREGSRGGGWGRLSETILEEGDLVLDDKRDMVLVW